MTDWQRVEPLDHIGDANKMVTDYIEPSATRSGSWCSPWRMSERRLPFPQRESLLTRA